MAGEAVAQIVQPRSGVVMRCVPAQANADSLEGIESLAVMAGTAVIEKEESGISCQRNALIPEVGIIAERFTGRRM